MDRTTLGRTGIEVSVAGLGCGGPSRLGRSYGRSADESAAVVRRAIDLGVTFIDTAEAYGTEEIVGKAIAGRRDEVVVSTKCFHHRDDGAVCTPRELRASLEASLERLGTDHVDVYLLHGVAAGQADAVTAELVPELVAMRDAGKVRAIGVSEAFISDPAHDALRRFLDADVWDVVMVGFNVLNQSATTDVFPRTASDRVGTLVMFAVRRALSRPDKLREVIDALRAGGELGEDLDGDDPLGFLLEHASSIPDAAYRFCRHTPGVDVVLTGTGDVDHLEENVRSIDAPPLPDDVIARLHRIFGAVTTVSGN